jgi:DNA-directed RNA polymerase specialized sigma24 family protein
VFDVERKLLFAQIRRQLSERDREICILLEQDVSSPGEIAKVLQISFAAAAKALQRVRNEWRPSSGLRVLKLRNPQNRKQ